MKKNLILFSTLLLISACTFYNVESEDATTKYYPSKKSADEVQYIENIKDKSEVIGYVTVTTERTQALESILSKMKREAAILGGDAITDIKTNASGEWKKLPAQGLIGNAYIHANFTASVVVLEKKEVKKEEKKSK